MYPNSSSNFPLRIASQIVPMLQCQVLHHRLTGATDEIFDSQSLRKTRKETTRHRTMQDPSMSVWGHQREYSTHRALLVDQRQMKYLKWGVVKVCPDEVAERL
ncbi:uncharacterized protein PHALS_12554 [Plasmopara halstedii]|uniref:Uncharacterized protein n=1 Tax=Plasmopara halstedii TaxID=4781 RepID=A0A0P1ALR4_PLAHL|nr:uncharacterized protein PHALS_12554 [Plasmopara halstedii]CEG42264.1 hypothetical protein PHALS_12554 [Plasmopara halstedii]|eukprot:XP_024578633.1 hypothetical protein PHALS_12554 [Plasmopara halstedii]